MKNYHIQGAVPTYSSAYIQRNYEQLIIDNLVRGDWVTLLGPRQHGKTTSLIRIKQALLDMTINVAYIDLQALPPINNFSHLIECVSNAIADSLGIEYVSRPDQGNEDQLEAWLNILLPEIRGPLVIIIDEASGIDNQEWRNTFFGQQRALSNMRADVPSDHLAARLRFLFAGTFRPETLVNTLNSPFNVTETIYTTDLTIKEVTILVQQVEVERFSQVEPFIERVFDLVSGHPYLIQYLFSQMRVPEGIDLEAKFIEVTTHLQYGHIDHFQNLIGPILDDIELTTIIATLVQDGHIIIQPGNYNHRYLETLGLVIRNENRLEFRNSLYLNIIRNSPQIVGALEDQDDRMSALYTPSEDQYTFMVSVELKEIALSYDQGAVRSYNSQNYRLSLIGFGAALEAILIDWLTNQPVGDRNVAITTARNQGHLNFNQYEDQTNPGTWRFVNLIKVARRLSQNLIIEDPPDALREWRNLVHPNVILENYLPEDALEPDARTASGLLDILKRNLR
jgi:hypothetical protein